MFPRDLETAASGVVLFLAAIAQADADRNTAKELRNALRDSSNPHVFVLAHRADWHDAPENSIAGIRNCLALGIDGIEIDIRRTKDGQFVLMHDKTVDRTTNGRGKVADLTFAQVRELNLRDEAGKLTAERVPTLEEAVRATEGKLLIYLDKTEEIIDEVNTEMMRLKATDQAIYYGSKPIEELHHRYGRLIDQLVYLPKLDASVNHAGKMVDDFATLRPAAFVLEFADMKSQTFAATANIRKAGSRVFVSPLWPTSAGGLTDEAALKDPDANWGWLLDHGVTVFCTDRPAELLSYLTRRGLRNDTIDPQTHAGAHKEKADPALSIRR